MKFSYMLAATQLVQFGVVVFDTIFNSVAGETCLPPVGDYYKKCSMPIIFTGGSWDSNITPYNLDDMVFPTCKMVTVCDSDTSAPILNYIEYPPNTQYSDVTNVDGKLHQNGLDFQEYSGAMLHVYNLKQRQQIAEKRLQKDYSDGENYEDIRKNNKVALRS